MKTKPVINVLLHALLGGLAAGLAMVPAGVPINSKNVLFPVVASAITSVVSKVTPGWSEMISALVRSRF